MRWFVPFFVVFLWGCDKQLPRHKASKHFDVPGLVAELVRNMNDRQFTVSKSFTLNGHPETKTIAPADSVFWARELSRLQEIDLNAPQYRDNLAITNKADSLSNLQVRVFTLREQKNLPLKKLALYYLNDPHEIRQLHLQLASNNFIAHTRTSLTLWLNRYSGQLLLDSLKITGSDAIVLQPAREYQTISKTVWPGAVKAAK